MGLLAINKLEDDEDKQVGQTFVKLRRMAGKVLAIAGKNKSPGHVGGMTHYFGVHQIAQSNEGRRERCDDAHVVEHVHHIHLGMLAVKPNSHKKTQHAAVARKALVAHQPPAARELVDGQQHLDGVTQVEGRLVEQAMAEARSDEHS